MENIHNCFSPEVNTSLMLTATKINIHLMSFSFYQQYYFYRANPLFIVNDSPVLSKIVASEKSVIYTGLPIVLFKLVKVFFLFLAEILGHLALFKGCQISA